jgi:peptidoglycan/LPS O-acetylase OafA/YrhL
MVTVFFLVSGYSLTLGSWATLHSGQTNKCLDHLCSSIFRRYIRLNLPVLASGSIVFCCTYFGLFEKTAAEDVRTGYREPQPQRFDSFTAQMMDFFKETIKYLNIWTDPTYRYPYYPHAWSIPVEFICSLFIYVFFIAVCKMRFVPQVVTFVILLTVTYLTSQVFYWIFLFGAFLAKLQVHFSDKFQSEKILSSDKHKIKFAMITMFGIGLWILSYPDWMWTSAPGYSLLSTYLPSWGEPFWLWHAIGASIILITTANSKEVQWLFSCTLSRFLGRVSYGLYLVHGIINHLLAFWMLPLIWKYTDSATTFQFEVGFWLYCIIHIPISLLAAHFFSITFDAPSIRFAKWLESRVSVDYITIGSNELVVRSELPLLPA